MGYKNFIAKTLGLGPRSVAATPGESQVRASERLSEAARKDVTRILDGRFVGMYELCRRTSERYKLHDPKGPAFPSPEETAASFSDEEIVLAGAYQKPALILCPPQRKREELFSVLNSGNRQSPVLNYTVISEPEYPEWDLDDEYRSFIVEGACRISPYDDSLSHSLVRRYLHKERTREAGETGMTGEIYALLGMQSVIRRKSMDQHMFTILDGMPIVENRYVPVAHFRLGHATMEWLPADIDQGGAGRFRRVIGGRFVNPEL